MQRRSATSRATAGGGGGRRSGGRPAAMLLEVLVSIAIMVLAVATIGGQVSESLATVEYTNKLNRALMLAEWVLAELDLPTEDRQRLIEIRGEEGEGTFGDMYPEYGWRIKREPTDVENLDLITLDILSGDPEKSVDEWKVLHSVYALRPIVAQLDPTDFGMPSEEDISALASAQAPTSGGEGTTDAGAMPPGVEDLLAALPGPLQEIFQRFLGGEAVPLDEIRAAFSELTTEDMIGLLATPALLGMLGGNMGGLTGQLMGGAGGQNAQAPAQATEAIDQALQQGGASDSSQQSRSGGRRSRR